jgi:hypothetical protein
VPRQYLGKRHAFRTAERQNFGNDDAAGVIAMAVDAIGVRRERIHAGRAVELQRKRRCVLGVSAASAATLAEHDARFAAGKYGGALARRAQLLRKASVLAPECLRFVVEIVAKL